MPTDTEDNEESPVTSPSDTEMSNGEYDPSGLNQTDFEFFDISHIDEVTHSDSDD